jgi:hypothetical protein
MKLSISNIFLRTMNLIAFALMVTINALSMTHPIGGKNITIISETYPSLFVPAGYVFSIWSVIYFLLWGFIVFQFLDLFLRRHEKPIYDFIQRKSGWFILSCLLNIGWLMAWQSEQIWLSLLAMTGLFLVLSFMYSWLGNYASWQHPKRFLLFFLVPIRISFGWISVAIFANIAALLASMGIWQSLNSQIFLTCVLVLFVLALVIYVLRFFRDYVFMCVGYWALIGILLKRLLTDPVETYPVILVVIFWLMLITYFFGVSRSKSHQFSDVSLSIFFASS